MCARLGGDAPQRQKHWHAFLSGSSVRLVFAAQPRFWCGSITPQNDLIIGFLLFLIRIGNGANVLSKCR